MNALRYTFALTMLWLGVQPATIVSAQEAVTMIGTDTAPSTILIQGTTDIAAFAPVMQAFVDNRPDVQIRYEQWGSNDLFALSVTACGHTDAAADLVISSAIDLQIKLVNDGCALSHHSPAIAALPALRNWRDQLFGVTEEPAVIIYNTELVSAEEAPESRFDLIDILRPADSRFAGRIATYDIEASGLGYLFAFVDSLQATTFGRLLEAFGRSGAVATCCSAEIIDAVADGRYLVAYNVLGSYALARAQQDPRIGVRAPSDYTLMLSRAALIPARAQRPDLAGQFIDFMLSGPGRTALRQSRLIVNVGQDDDADLQIGGAGASTIRQIPLSPVLLAGLDQHKRRLFVQLWRQNLDLQ